METMLFPVIKDEKNLPFYVTCIGEHEEKSAIVRKNGYFNPQIIFCTKGKGILTTDLFTITITPGMVFFLPEEYPHEYKAEGDEGWFTSYVSFDGYASGLVLRELGFTKPMVFTVDITELDKIFKKIIYALKSDRTYGPFEASGLIYQYITKLYLLTRPEQPVQIQENQNEVLKKAVNYMDDNFTETIELNDLCKVTQVSPQYLCRIFKKYLGMRPLEYITDLRIQKAKQLLIDHKLSVKQVAESVGYADAGYFSTVFKQKEGLAPKDFINAKR